MTRSFTEKLIAELHLGVAEGIVIRQMPHLRSASTCLQSQRDLYIAMRDLFVRHDRLAVDNVDRLKKRIDSNSMKLESIKANQKDGWQEDADRVVVLIEKDQAAIASLLSRRVFIRAWWVLVSLVLLRHTDIPAKYVA